MGPVVHHEERADLRLVHQAQRLGGERAGGDGLGAAGGDLARGALHQHVDVAPQVAVGDHAHQTVALHHPGEAEALGGHGDQPLAHGRVGGEQGHRLAPVHQPLDLDELGAELAARVENLEILPAEALAVHQRHGERVAERQRRGGGGGGGDADDAGLGRGGKLERHVRLLAEGAVLAAGDGDQRDGEAAAVGDEVGELRGLAGIGDHQADVIGGDHPEVAVARLGGVDEHGGGAGGGEGGGDLAPDVAGLADAADDDAPGGAGEDLHRPGVAVVERLGHEAQGVGFDAKHPLHLVQVCVLTGDACGHRFTHYNFTCCKSGPATGDSAKTSWIRK